MVNRVAKEQLLSLGRNNTENHMIAVLGKSHPLQNKVNKIFLNIAPFPSAMQHHLKIGAYYFYFLQYLLVDQLISDSVVGFTIIPFETGFYKGSVLSPSLNTNLPKNV